RLPAPGAAVRTGRNRWFGRSRPWDHTRRIRRIPRGDPAAIDPLSIAPLPKKDKTAPRRGAVVLRTLLYRIFFSSATPRFLERKLGKELPAKLRFARSA